jgi:hypothetical protein
MIPRWTSALSSALLVGGLLAACNGTPSTDGAPPDADAGGPGDAVADADAGGITADDLTAKAASARCAYIARCEARYYYAECERDPNGSAPDFARLAAAVKSGRKAMDPKLAQACLDGIANAPCSPSDALPEAVQQACSAAFTPVARPGDDCLDSSDCVDGWCDATCNGTCHQNAHLGEPCGQSSACSSGLTCSTKTFTCQPLYDDGTTCRWGRECKSGYCRMATTVSGTCAPAPPARGTGTDGAKCTNVSQCAYGFYCANTPSGVMCKALIAQGDTCGAGDIGGALEGCANGLVCAGGSATSGASGTQFVAGTCSAWSDVGGPCVPAPANTIYDNTGCMIGLNCGSDRKCAPPPSSGPCATSGAACDPAAYCDGADDTCKPRKPDGEACADSSQCQSHICDSKTAKCVPPLSCP